MGLVRPIPRLQRIALVGHFTGAEFSKASAVTMHLPSDRSDACCGVGAPCGPGRHAQRQYRRPHCRSAADGRAARSLFPGAAAAVVPARLGTDGRRAAQRPACVPSAVSAITRHARRTTARFWSATRRRLSIRSPAKASFSPCAARNSPPRLFSRRCRPAMSAAAPCAPMTPRGGANCCRATGCATWCSVSSIRPPLLAWAAERLRRSAPLTEVLLQTVGGSGTASRPVHPPGPASGLGNIYNAMHTENTVLYARAAGAHLPARRRHSGLAAHSAALSRSQRFRTDEGRRPQGRRDGLLSARTFPLPASRFPVRWRSVQVCDPTAA